MTVSPERAEALRREYASCSTARARAEFESMVLLEVRRGAPTGDWHEYNTRVAQMLGETIYAVKMRRQLLLKGDAGEPLWELIDRDLPLSAALDIVRKAKAARIQAEPMMTAVRRVAAEYQARPAARTLPGNKVTRAASPAERKTSKASVGQTNLKRGPDTLLAQVRELCREYARSRLPDHGADVVDAEVRRLETDLKVVVEQFEVRVRALHRREPLHLVLNRRQVKSLCEILLLDPPKNMQAISEAWKAKAKRQFRTLARQCHPDTHGGSETLRARYEAVVAAWEKLRSLTE